MYTTHAKSDACLDSICGNTNKLNFYTGSPPGADAGASGTLLVSLDASAGSAGWDSVNLRSQKTVTVTAGNVTSAGTAGYWRVLDSGSAVIAEGNISDFNFNRLNWTVGEQVSVTSFTLYLSGLAST